MSNREKESHYVTFNPAKDQDGQSVLALLEVTQKSIAFMEMFGYEQRLVEKYGRGIMIWLAFLTSSVLSFFLREIRDFFLAILK